MKGITRPDCAQNLQRPQVAESRASESIGQHDIRPDFAEPLGVIRFGGHSLAVRVESEAGQFVGDQFKIGEVVFNNQEQKVGSAFPASLGCLIGARGVILGVSGFSGSN